MMTNTIKEQIKAYLQKQKKKSLSVEELASGLGLQKSEDFKLLVQTIASMEREKSIEFTKKGKVKLPMPLFLIQGIFRANERGFGFVTIDEEEEDIFIPQGATGYAMDGDTVAIDIVKPALPGSDKGAEGKVVKVVERAFSEIVGEFHLFDEKEIADSDLYGYVTPKEKKLQDFKVYISAVGIRPVDGAIVKVTISHYPEPGYETSAEGMVLSVIGHKNDPGMDIMSIIVSHGLATDFSDETIKEANKIEDTVNPDLFATRKDLRGERIVTIDGEDAKDLDDAVTVRKLANGNFFLGVHIADVSYYVQSNSSLDREAYERGTSVYLTDRVIPMLPQRLSNGICSLNPHVPRLAMSCEMEIDQQGKVQRHDIFQSVIQTTERMTYTAVNEILEENDSATIERYKELVPMFQDMAELHEILANMRLRRGAVSFEDNEAKIIVNDEGHPTNIVFRSRGIGERMIESFMLAANETVAEHFNRQHFPFIYRIHEEPKEEKVQRFFNFAAALGILVKQTKGTISPKDLQGVLEDVAGKPEAPVISTMLLRSMQQAKYSELNEGHYGLAADYYTHFTSPIRRYPDLIVHRLIRSYERDRSEQNQQSWAEKLPDIALHSSQMERKAVEVEREVDAMKKAEFMADHIDEEFAGMISSVVKFGFFVELENTVEGLIHINELNDDYYHYIDTHLALVGERTGRTFKIGQKVVVRVVKSDPDTREIDFELVEAEEVELVNQKEGKNQRKSRNSKEKVQRNGKNEWQNGKPRKPKRQKKPFYKEVAKKKKHKKN